MPDWRKELRDRSAEFGLAPQDEHELIEELAQHLDEEFDELSPRLGASEAERVLRERLESGALRALARARRQAADRHRESPARFHAGAPVHRMAADVRLALRRARRRIGFTTIAVLSLAIGVGANTAVFSLVDAILLRRLPVPHREQIAELYQHQSSFPYAPFSYPDYQDFRVAARGLYTRMSVAAYAAVSHDMGDRTETLFTELVSGDYFPLLELPPTAGRLLGPDDDVGEGAHAVVVLSTDYWRRAYGADPEVVGRKIRLSGRDYTIVGVAPSAYHGTMPGIVPALYAPVTMINQLQASSTDQLTVRNGQSMFAKVRLAPGVTMAQLRTVAASFTRDMARRYPASWPAGTYADVVPETQVAANPMIDAVVVPAAATLSVVVALVLLVACANLASFLLAQASDRRREIAIRIALGARRWLLVRQLLVESLLLAVLGAGAGLLLSRVALNTLLNSNLPFPLPIRLDVAIDGRVLAFTAGVAGVAALLIGMLPALQATRPDVVEVIKHANTGGGPRRRVTLRSGLVVGQVAVSLVLLVTAALFLRSLQAREHIDPGFGAAPAGVAWFGLPPGTDTGARQQQLLDDIEARTARLDGVRAVGMIDNLPLSLTNTQADYVTVDGVPSPPGEPGFEVDYASIDSGFLGAAGIPLVRGRNVRPGDGPGAPPVAVINEAMAARFWPGRDAVGQTFHVDSTVYTVVGVARTTKVRSLTESPRMAYYASLRQRPSSYLYLVARSRGDAEATAAGMLGAMRAANPRLMVMQTTTMARRLATLVLPTQLGAMAFALFAVVALLLATIGVYGVVSYAVARRAREVGIRMALGAEPRAIVRLLMREGVGLVATGAAVGLVLAVAAGRALDALLSGVTGADPLAFAAAPLVLVAVGVLAAFVPARRSTRTDPVKVLRAE